MSNNCVIYQVSVKYHEPPGSFQGMLTYSLLSGSISFQYLSTTHIRIMTKDLTEIGCACSVLEIAILGESRAAKMRP